VTTAGWHFVFVRNDACGWSIELCVENCSQFTYGMIDFTFRDTVQELILKCTYVIVLEIHFMEIKYFAGSVNKGRESAHVFLLFLIQVNY
jgi:hypothetical protein